jgi:cholesterol transport system auxiliary component
MIPMRLKLLACSALLVASLALSGCGQSAIANRKYYLLDTKRQGPPASFHSDATLRVSQFHVDQAFAGRQLVYRVEATRYEPDFYDQFLIPPGNMITEETRDWLADSGLFRRVTSVSSLQEATYVLEGNVIDLYADFTTGSTPRAVMEIRFFLVAGPDANEAIPLVRTYRAESPISARTAGGVATALSSDLADILTRLEADLENVLTRRSQKTKAL